MPKWDGEITDNLKVMSIDTLWNGDLLTVYRDIQGYNILIVTDKDNKTVVITIKP